MGIALSIFGGGTGLYIMQRFWPTRRELAEATLTSGQVEKRLRESLVKEIDRLEKRMGKIEGEMALLEAENLALRVENQKLRGRVASLEADLARLGGA